MKTIPLREVAHARSGDKGDISNVGVIAYDEDDYELLREQVTAERVKTQYGDLVLGEVRRYELPNIGALNFVLSRALGGGVTTSLALDPHGKTRSSVILDLPIAVPDDYVPPHRWRSAVDLVSFAPLPHWLVGFKQRAKHAGRLGPFAFRGATTTGG